MKKIRSLISSVIAGFVNGFLGTGGGTIIYLCCDEGAYKQKQVQSFMIALICIFSALGAVLTKADNPMNIWESAAILAGSLPGVLVGVKILRWASGKSIRIIFSLLLIVSGIKMLL